MSALPPGRDGLPLLGETLSFAKNPFRFIEDRLTAHGRIFRSSVLGRKTAVIAGAEAAGHFIDPSLVMREGSMPPHVQELFGGRSLPLLDGDVHSARKRTITQAFTREALADYLPSIVRTTEDYFERWSREAEIGWVEELKRLAIEIICTTVIGMPRGDEMNQLRRDYGLVTAGFATLPSTCRAPVTAKRCRRATASSTCSAAACANDAASRRTTDCRAFSRPEC
jgi:cytochrome P450